MFTSVFSVNGLARSRRGEIGRAQALQARAARVESTNDMNLVLLKVSGEAGLQVIIHLAAVVSNLLIWNSFKDW